MMMKIEDYEQVPERRMKKQNNRKPQECVSCSDIYVVVRTCVFLFVAFVLFLFIEQKSYTED